MATENSIMLTERTDELLNRGRSQGFLSTEEVADLVQEGDLSATEVEEFYATLEEEEITVVEVPEVETPDPVAVHVSEVPAVQIAHAVQPKKAVSWRSSLLSVIASLRSPCLVVGSEKKLE